MKIFIKLFLFIIIGFNIGHANEIVPERLNPLQAIEIKDASEILSSDTIKFLKKEFKAKSITSELWPGDKHFFVLHKGRESALLDENLNPILFKSSKGEDRFYFYNLAPTLYNNRIYFLGTLDPTIPVGIYSDEYICIVEHDHFDWFEGVTLNNIDYILGWQKKGTFGMLCTDGRGAWAIGTDLKFYPAQEAGFVEIAPGFSIWQPAHDDFFTAISKGASCVFWHDVDNNYKLMFHKNAFVLPGGGYLAREQSKRPKIDFRAVTRDLGNGDTGEFNEMTVTSFSPLLNNLFITNISGSQIYAENCSRVIFSEPDQIAYTIRYYGKPHFIYRRGGIDLTDLSMKIEPKYNNVFFFTDDTGATVPWVKNTAFSQLTTIDCITPDNELVLPKDENELNFEKAISDLHLIDKYDKTYFLLTSIDISDKIKHNEVLTEKDKAMLLSCLINMAEGELQIVQGYINSYYNMENPALDPKKRLAMEFDAHGRPSLSDAAIKTLILHKNQLQELIDNGLYEDKEYALATVENITNTCELIDNLRTEGIGKAYDTYQEKLEAQRLEALRLESERQAQIRKDAQERLAAAIFGVICNIGSQLAQSSYKAKKSSYISGATIPHSGDGSAPSTSGGESNAGRKGFLKGQIAEWKNKLKKAEASYQQALSSGDDSWEKKRVIESKRNTVDECLNMIRQFESELNSLK